MIHKPKKFSFQVRFYIVLSLVLIHLLFSLNPNDSQVNRGKLRNIETYSDLENQSIFNFSIFSDNHGNSPYSNVNMAKANYHIRKTNDICVLGGGDHMMKNGTNDFLFYMCNDSFWKDNFYPTISDGENIFYGNSQSDWGAGKPFFDAIGMKNRKNVTFSPEGVDYYAVIEAPHNYRIHFISLHFPDEPDNTQLAFHESSKNFLRESLLRINKTDHDIIVLAAHSRFGFWLNELRPDLYRLVMNKADLVFGSSTHYYEKFSPEGYATTGPLILNTGSVVSPRFGSAPGFVQVHVLEQHRGIFVNYVDVSKPTTVLGSSPFAYFRSFAGKIYDIYYQSVIM